MDWPLAPLVVELIEKVGLLRRDLEHHADRERYEARLARITQKVTALATAVEATDPAAAKALRSAWDTPARSLAFRNNAHRTKDAPSKGLGTEPAD